MKCQWKWCCEEAVVHLFRPVDAPTYEIIEGRNATVKERAPNSDADRRRLRLPHALELLA